MGHWNNGWARTPNVKDSEELFMVAKSTKLILIICLFTTLLMSILACVTSPSPNREAIKRLDITMDVAQVQEFRTQVEKFANKHSLEYTEKFYNTDGYFSVFMVGDDYHIVLNNYEDNLGRIGLDLFNKASPPISQKTLAELVDDLKGFINEIPNVKITERMMRLKIGIEEDQKKKILPDLFAQLQKNADKYSLEIKTSSYDPSLDTFLVEMQGRGFLITIDTGHNVTGEINLIFYMDFDNNVVPAITPTPQETLAELVGDLKDYLSEFPNVTITELP
jgi:hypothetical protein